MVDAKSLSRWARPANLLRTVCRCFEAMSRTLSGQALAGPPRLRIPRTYSGVNRARGHADEPDSLKMVLIVDAVAALGARRGGDQADLFELADRLDVHARPARCFSDRKPVIIFSLIL